ncbi:MAG: aspartyl/glutamyl-tRNA(Asn/Gln) amidotransferase subunit B [Fimbriimonadales bacterium]|nr:MAG: aspartyl/glutamyl-tRNA(Asn/Gln) amidotransferase subunit B [Fimbriimonadales bacterium]
MEYLPSIGIEVHAELLTTTKMFCGCRNQFGGEVNTRVCPVCLGLPGSLPVPNRKAVELVLRTALALNCNIARRSLFHRKNYFYPDLPKGYQISQYEETNPIGYHGYLEIPNPETNGETDMRVRIRRVHLEEDTGKLMHLPDGGSGVDYNRAGVPLMEIVTDHPPDIHSPEAAREYVQQLRLLLLYLNVCDGKMEQGSLRCEPNISIAPIGSETLGTKTELKNLSSFRALVSGIEHEINRMKQALEVGEALHQETRGWNEDTQTSYPMRTKEGEADYRYFTDPDLPPLVFTDEEIERVRQSLPELPLAKRKRYIHELGLDAYDAGVLIQDPAWADFFDRTVSLGTDPKLACNWMNGDFARLLNESGQTVQDTKIQPEHLRDLIALLQAGTINGRQAKDVLELAFRDGRMPGDIVEQEGMKQITDDSAIRGLVQRVLEANPDVVERYKQGKTSVKGFLVGQVMKETKGKANPGLVNQILDEELSR